MKNNIRSFSEKVINKVLPVSPQEQFKDITEPKFWELYDLVKDQTMVSVPNLYYLFRSINYILENDIPGDFVECGVWRGGCSMLAAKMFADAGVTDRDMYLFDTFEGMSEPTENDVDFRSVTAETQLKSKKSTHRNSIWCIANLEVVRQNMESTGYDMNKIHFVEGKVEDTLKDKSYTEKISILRLDTDWYESTKMELVKLYPSLQKGGVLIIDDYGHWQGSRKATNEYFEENNLHPLLVRIDYTCYTSVKN